jgi:hypothetical protein
VFTKTSAARYQGRLLALTTEEHEALVELVEDDVTPPDDVISTVGARLVALVPERGKGGRGRN